MMVTIVATIFLIPETKKFAPEKMAGLKRKVIFQPSIVTGDMLV